MSGHVVVSWDSTRGAQEPRATLGGDVIVVSAPARLDRLVRDAPAPVLLVRGCAAEVERVVVPLDVIAGPWRVGPATLGLADAHGAEVVLVAVGDPRWPSLRRRADEAERLFEESGARTRLVLAGPAPLSRLASLLEAEAPDVVALATQPRSPSSIADATAEQALEHLLHEGTTSLLVVGDRAERSRPARRSPAGRS